MECNKEEALRAKVLAENKMRGGDFIGARKIAQKALQLFPEIENIAQLLTVCDVHCSSMVKINGTETDLYGILQVERNVDESVIKKQYRKLALLLHPDKNKFSGAEAAFKLIGEANMVLSDPTKRKMFDIKTKVVVKSTKAKAPPHHSNSNAHLRNQYGARGAPSSHFTARVNNQTPVPPNQLDTFWTFCPFCNIRFQYYRDIINRALHCQLCNKPFIAYDFGHQGVPVTLNQSTSNQQKEVPASENCGQRVQNNSSNFPPVPGFPVNAGGKGVKAAVPKKGSSNAEVDRHPVDKGRDFEHVDMSDKTEKVHLPHADKAMPQDSRTSRKTKPKKGRKLVVESSESSMDSKSEETSCENPVPDSGADSGRYPRRSSRQKRNISYSENLSDDEYPSLPKKSKNKRSHVGDFNVKEDANGPNMSRAGGDLSHNSAESVENITGKRAEDVKEESLSHEEDTRSKVYEDDVKSELDSKFFDVPDPEFNDFDKAREDRCFAVGQIWAVYDNTDGMPRFYARVVKVILPGFMLHITWLEPMPDHEYEINWQNEQLPICCGKFEHGKTVKNNEKPMFSHLVQFNKGSTRNTYRIYPRKGETWAMFSDWDIHWSSDPEKHRIYGLEVVQVLSDFDENNGVRVGYLEKVDGFVSLFRKATKGMISARISATEKYRFSHQIPSFITNGSERESVEAGYFELDPAALPSHWFEPRHTEKTGIGNTATGVGSRADNKEDHENRSNTHSKNTNTGDQHISDSEERPTSSSEEIMKSRSFLRSRSGGTLDKKTASEVEEFEKFAADDEIDSDMGAGKDAGTVKYPTKVRRSLDPKIPIKEHGVNGGSEQNTANVSVDESETFSHGR